MVGDGAGRSCGAGSRRRAASISISSMPAFLERYTARPADRSTVHQDVIQVLHGLQAHGLRPGVCTNKAPTERLFAALGSTGFFR